MFYAFACREEAKAKISPRAMNRSAATKTRYSGGSKKVTVCAGIQKKGMVIAAFGKLNEDFEDRDTQVLGGSTDNEFCHFNWRATHPELKDIPFPMFADIKHDLIRALGVENATGTADRATYIIDPDG